MDNVLSGPPCRECGTGLVSRNDVAAAHARPPAQSVETTYALQRRETRALLLSRYHLR